MTKRGRGKAHKHRSRAGHTKDGGGQRAAASKRGAGRPHPGAGPGGPRRHAPAGLGGGERGPAPKFIEAALAKTRAALERWFAEAEHIKSRPHSSAGDVALDPWQQDVLDALVQGRSVVVDAPTTAGKTRAVEAYFRQHLRQPGFRAAYTTPVKSLSNDKLREFRAMFGSENVGIATGDVKENLGAPIVVATLESYRNSLLGVEPDLGRTLVVFDEYHYLQDESRGSAWEEALILTPRHCQVLLLSASVANAEEFVDWLRTLGGDGSAVRDTVLVRTVERPVPLAPLVYAHGEWLLPDALPDGALRSLDKNRMQFPLRQEELAGRCAPLVSLGLTPCIIYCGRRLACETMAGLLARGLPPLPEAESARIGASLEASHAETGALSFIHPRLRQMLQVYGVGFHHSGLAAPARMAIEQLVKHGLLRFCTATMGLSLGINFSVRSALISDYQRPGELGFTDYAPSEALQMLGRAGRRGRDAVGFSLWPTPESLARLGKARRDAVTSRLRNDPTTFLGLVGRGFSLRAIETFYGKSFLRFKDRHIDLSLITRSRLEKKLGASDLPCSSPAAEYGRFLQREDQPDVATACPACPYRGACHPFLAAKAEGGLTALHLHLHGIGALERDERLSSFGSIARYFPQAGGLLIARFLADGRITADSMHGAAELAAALALARFKEPGGDPRYRLPFDTREIESALEALYPYELFPEVYDAPFKQRSYPVLREFNPAAGYIVRAWLEGMPWAELIAEVTHEQYGTGDVMALLYRTATYLQSMIQAGMAAGLADMARTTRGALLREPLAFALEI